MMDETRLPRLRPLNRHTLIPALPFDQLVEPDHPVRAVWEYVQALDLTAFVATIAAREGRPGRHATDPRLLLALWLWATADGVGSARALDRLCHEHQAYRWLAGNVTLNYHTLSAFRSQHEAELDGLLEQHVTALLHQGLIDLNRVAQDGMRTRASAGSGSFHRDVSLAACQTLVHEQIALLKQQADEPSNAVTRRQQAAQERAANERAARLEAARQVAATLAVEQTQRQAQHPKEAAERGTKDRPARASSTDPEARRMKMADGGTRPGYNVQSATTVGTGIVIAVAVTNQGSDGGLMGAMLDQIETTYDAKPAAYLVDGGYNNKADVERAAADGIAVYMPLKNAAKELASGANPYLPKKGDKAGMKALRARMGTTEGQALYRQRSATAEWVNAGMRRRGLYQVLVRGTSKVRSVVLLHALVHNLWQTRRLVTRRANNGVVPAWTEILRADRRPSPAVPVA